MKKKSTIAKLAIEECCIANMIIMTCQTGHYAKKVSICVHNAVVLKMVLLQNKTREKEEIEKRPQIDTSNTKAFHWDFQYAWQSLSDNIE
jgi:hypothetical protein